MRTLSDAFCCGTFFPRQHIVISLYWHYIGFNRGQGRTLEKQYDGFRRMTQNNKNVVNKIGIETTVVSGVAKDSTDDAYDKRLSEDETSVVASGDSSSDEMRSSGSGQDNPSDPSALLGAAVWLMLSSSAHKHLFVTDFEWLVVPPILAKQFRLFRRNNVPVGFISWASLDDEVEARIINGSVKLAPNEWTRGKNFWIIDVIAPFGGGDDMLKDLKENVFKDQVVKYIQADDDGRRVEILK